MGDTLVGSEGLYDPANGWRFADDTSPTAGEYIATHVDLQGVSAAQLQAIKDRLTVTQTKLTAAQYNGITKEDLLGDMLYSTALAYFSANQSASHLSSNEGVVEYRKPSFGSFSTTAKPSYWFGIVTSISFPCMTMDITRYVSMNVAKDNDIATAISYNLQMGMTYSANEHLVPEKMFANPADPNQPQSISAVKALSLAASQGQKVYTLSQANLGKV